MTEKFKDWEMYLIQKYPEHSFGRKENGKLYIVDYVGSDMDLDPEFEMIGYEFLDQHPKAPRKTLTHLANGKKNF